MGAYGDVIHFWNLISNFNLFLSTFCTLEMQFNYLRLPEPTDSFSNSYNDNWNPRNTGGYYRNHIFINYCGYRINSCDHRNSNLTTIRSTESMTAISCDCSWDRITNRYITSSNSYNNLILWMTKKYVSSIVYLKNNKL